MNLTLGEKLFCQRNVIQLHSKRLVPEVRVYSPERPPPAPQMVTDEGSLFCPPLGPGPGPGAGLHRKVGHPLPAPPPLAAPPPPAPRPEPKPTMVTWENTFNQRGLNLAQMPTHSNSYKASYRSHSMRAKLGSVSSPAKSLNLLRESLQRSINREIQEILQHYLDKFFRPAIENIKRNNGPNSVSEQHLQAICRQILEEAKKMYYVGLYSRCNSPVNPATVGSAINCEDDATVPGLMNGALGVHASDPSDNWRDRAKGQRHGKRIHRDTDSESEVVPTAAHRNHKQPGRKRKVNNRQNHVTGHGPSGGRGGSRAHFKSGADPIRREGPKWDPSRLSTETKFVLGSKANKALGFGTTRGRLYTKHADLFRYIGDQEDKQWLSERSLMPPAGGRAYLLLKEDITDLIESPEYRGVPGVNASDMGQGFEVPESMILKMQVLMAAMSSQGDSRKQKDKDKDRGREKENALCPKSTLVPPSRAGGDNSSVTSSISSTQPSIELSRPESGGVSSLDDLDLRDATVGSPFSGTGLSPLTLECHLEAQQISPIASDISSTLLNDVHI